MDALLFALSFEVVLLLMKILGEHLPIFYYQLLFSFILIKNVVIGTHSDARKYLVIYFKRFLNWIFYFIFSSL